MISEETIQQAARLLGEAAASPARVYVFGSYARGDAKADSDIDFLVIEREVENRRAEAVRLYGALAPLPLPADIVLISEGEAATPASPAVRDAIFEGRLVYEHAGSRALRDDAA